MKISIIGGGNMGGAIARGLASSSSFKPQEITIIERLESKAKELKLFDPNLNVAIDDLSSIEKADIIIIAVKPWDVQQVLTENIKNLNTPNQIIISVAASISLAQLDQWSGHNKALFCAIPNTAIEVKQSMTFLAALNTTEEQNKIVLGIFRELGSAELIEESTLSAATALCSCGIAYGFRYIRAAMQGGVELGLYPEQAKKGVIQTLRGAIELLEAHNSHPEAEIDKVTTAGGITIKGLNEMEHAGFSSAIIRGLKASK